MSTPITFDQSNSNSRILIVGRYYREMLDWINYVSRIDGCRVHYSKTPCLTLPNGSKVSPITLDGLNMAHGMHYDAIFIDTRLHNLKLAWESAMMRINRTGEIFRWVV